MVEMEMLQVFHMNKGKGEASYAKNSTVQNKILSITKPFLEAAIEDYLTTFGYFPETMAIAELGCSSGPNALMAVSETLDAVAEKCLEFGRRKSPKFMVFLNDLPGNDFNEVFGSLASFHAKLKEEKGADFGPCFIAGLPGSFHGRLVPNNCLHIVHSSSSLHWLSQVPAGLDGKENGEMVNKGKIYLSKTSSKSVISAYMLQFRKDFMSFLKYRSKEVISGGRMVLAFMGRNSADPACEIATAPWDLMASTLMTMVSEGILDEEKVDSFNVPYYAPCLEELKQTIGEEASFSLDRFEAFDVEWDGGDQRMESLEETRGERIARMHRAVVESMLDHHFGRVVVDQLFTRYARIVDDLLSKQALKLINLVISLTRN